LNLTASILYSQKALFDTPDHFRTYQVFLIIRLILIALVSGYLLYKNYLTYNIQPVDLERKRARQLKRRGLMLYWALPFNMWLGSYRTFLVKDYTDILMLNLLIEAFLQSVPTLVVGLKSSHPQDRTSFQKYQLVMNSLNLIEIAIQMIRVIIGVKRIRDMRTAQAVGKEHYIPATEEEKRDKYSGPNKWLAALGAVTFALILIFVGSSLPKKACPERQGYTSSGMCARCSDPQCLDCSNDYTKCERCGPGFSLLNGNCNSCVNLNPNCLECNSFNGCTACQPTYILSKGQCLSCVSVNKGCQACDA
jgi:hypothetical protein